MRNNGVRMCVAPMRLASWCGRTSCDSQALAAIITQKEHMSKHSQGAFFTVQALLVAQTLTS